MMQSLSELANLRLGWKSQVSASVIVGLILNLLFTGSSRRPLVCGRPRLWSPLVRWFRHSLDQKSVCSLLAQQPHCSQFSQLQKRNATGLPWSLGVQRQAAAGTKGLWLNPGHCWAVFSADQLCVPAGSFLPNPARVKQLVFICCLLKSLILSFIEKGLKEQQHVASVRVPTGNRWYTQNRKVPGGFIYKGTVSNV